MEPTTMVHLEMEPTSGKVDISKTALLIIDMQRDFLEAGGFGEALGNDVSKLRVAISPCQKVLAAARAKDMLVIHTREGHRADMTDVFSHKKSKKDSNGAGFKTIGERGPMGRILIRGEPGHDIVSELYPKPGEPVVDKPGKGSFYGTDLEVILAAKNVSTLFVCGVTTEVCVHTTVREANDRGFHCIVVGDCCASYFEHFHGVALKMITAQNGIFGSVTIADNVVTSLSV